MPHLLVTVLLLQLIIHIVNSVGVSTINNLLWALYNSLPTPTSASVQRQRILQREVLRLRKELGSTSSQDEFARWAKLRRQHDKALGELEKTSQSLTSSRTSFDQTLGFSRWASTNGLRFVLQFWYAKEPLFWLPQGWLPRYAEWLLAFPRAPTGSISIQVWGMACMSVIQLFSAIVAAVYGYWLRQSSGGERAEPQKHAAAPAGATLGMKKEL
ncbi:MAG: GET complex subunit get1 [Thelocarpon impressellum]|nr:MAG: GET complex subunit get1 [Thelocarpon impressellum]